MHGRVAAAAGGDQARCQSFLVVEKDLEQMLGNELLVALAQGQALGRLNETACPLGEFLDIHALSRPAPLFGRMGNGSASASPARCSSAADHSTALETAP